MPTNSQTTSPEFLLETADWLAERLYDAIQQSSNDSSRSRQSKGFVVGVSDLGFCSERTRRMLDQQVPTDTDALAAFIGTAIGDHAEQAAKLAWPNAMTQQHVMIRLKGESGREYVVAGHPDLILAEEGILVDLKTTNGLYFPRRKGPSQQQQFQRHCYAKGAWEAGYFGSLPLSEVMVANLWIDRSAQEKELHCDLERYDEGYVEAAAQWIDDVVYAYLNGEEARKEPPRELCAAACGFYDVCRAYDTDVEGLITDDTQLMAVEMYLEGSDLERQGRRLKDQAKIRLNGVTGSTGEYLVRWTRINDTTLPATFRAGYSKLDIKKIPGKR